jgi:hypothetical protein
VPLAGFAAVGAVGGSFSPSSMVFSLTNSSSSNLLWSLVNTSAWLNVSATSGTLAPNKSSNITVSVTAAANNLTFGSYAATIIFSNQTTHATLPQQFSLQTLPALVVSPASGFTASGPGGGVFNVTTQNFALTNLSVTALNWGVVNTSVWLSVSSSGGALAGAANTSLPISLNSTANTLPAGIYAATVLVTNQTGPDISLNFALSIGQDIVQNGGFEQGMSLPNWTAVVANDYLYSFSGVHSYNVVPHTGTYDFIFGQSGSLAYLSQNLVTIPGQDYLLSFWLTDNQGGSTEIFQANWNTNATTTNTIYNLTNPTSAFAWTNLNFVVTATGTNTTLQFAGQNNLDFFGLDDVSVTPIPLPTVTSFGKMTNAFTLNWNSLTGIVYQVQYKTNLLQAGWLTNTTLTATAAVTSFTNAIGPAPQRFYRVRRLP